MLKAHHIRTSNYFSTMINHVSELVIGVNKIVGIYNDLAFKEKFSGVSLTLKNNKLIEEELNMQGSFDKLTFIQNEKFHYKWLNKSQVPYEMETENTGQLNIFNEYTFHILLISVPQRVTDKKSLVFIYFKDELDQFGVHHHKASLSTQNKSIIGHLVSNSVISLSNTYWEQEEKFIQFASKSQQVITQLSKNDKKSSREEEIENLLKGWAYDILEDFCESDGVNYVYSENAIKKIVSFNGEFSLLRKAITEAIDYTRTFNTYLNVTFVTIEEDYINLVTNMNTISKPCDSLILPQRLQKTHELLDKLEKYAIQVSNDGQNITSYNVGKAMERQITPAAISDALNKNRSRINTLFKQFPVKWNFIRNNFRPIINISSADNVQLKKWS